VRARRTAPGLLLAALLLTSGCGGDASPADAAPALVTRLEGVDAAIAAGDFDRARTALRALSTSAARAERAGDLADGQADRINDAVAALLAQLPDEATTEEPTPSEPTPSQPTPSEPTPPEPTTESTPEPSQSSEPAPAEEEPKPDKGHGKDKDRDKEKKDDDDDEADEDD
jgi:outer membrane biosynthesis protein TonB